MSLFSKNHYPPWLGCADGWVRVLPLSLSCSKTHPASLLLLPWAGSHAESWECRVGAARR